MPSFDVVSEVDMHEATNAVDQANREVTTRFDFKGTNARFEKTDNEITMKAEAELGADLQGIVKKIFAEASQAIDQQIQLTRVELSNLKESKK